MQTPAETNPTPETTSPTQSAEPPSSLSPATPPATSEPLIPPPAAPAAEPAAAPAPCSEQSAPPAPSPLPSAAPPALDVGILGKVETLTEQEVVDYQTLEAIVTMGWQNFAEVGIALGEIRDRRLYRTEFTTFEDYCRAKWRYHRTYVYRLITASQLFRHLSTNCRQTLPDHESQIRPLFGFSKDQALQAWEKAAENAAGRRITAQIVSSAARQLNLSTGTETTEKQTTIKAPSKKQLRQQIMDAARDMLTALHQKADHATLVARAEALYMQLRAAFATKQRKAV